jgi:hypothetical protein
MARASVAPTKAESSVASSPAQSANAIDARASLDSVSISHSTNPANPAEKTSIANSDSAPLPLELGQSFSANQEATLVLRSRIGRQRLHGQAPRLRSRARRASRLSASTAPANAMAL